MQTPKKVTKKTLYYEELFKSSAAPLSVNTTQKCDTMKKVGATPLKSKNMKKHSKNAYQHTLER